MLTHVFQLLPLDIRSLLERMPQEPLESLEEIRIREDRPLEISCSGESRFVAADGCLIQEPDGAYRPSAEQCRKLLEKITNYSLYAMEEELRRGYITVAGGHRIGLAGRTILEGGAVRGIRDIGGFNIRIARERIGAASFLMPKLMDRNSDRVFSSLLLAPPQQGKTTLVRDIARSLSYGYWKGGDTGRRRGRKVGIVDERSEIAACVRGVPTFDVGPRSDVMDACPKAEGMMMLLRSMSPEVLIADEIGRPEDGAAITEASHAGVSVIATAHAFDLSDAKGRPELKKLLEQGAFSQIVELRRTREGVMHRVIQLQMRGSPQGSLDPGNGWSSLAGEQLMRAGTP